MTIRPIIAAAKTGVRGLLSGVTSKTLAVTQGGGIPPTTTSKIQGVLQQPSHGKIFVPAPASIILPEQRALCVLGGTGTLGGASYKRALIEQTPSGEFTFGSVVKTDTRAKVQGIDFKSRTEAPVGHVIAVNREGEGSITDPRWWLEVFRDAGRKNMKELVLVNSVMPDTTQSLKEQVEAQSGVINAMRAGFMAARAENQEAMDNLAVTVVRYSSTSAALQEQLSEKNKWRLERDYPAGAAYAQSALHGENLYLNLGKELNWNVRVYRLGIVSTPPNIEKKELYYGHPCGMEDFAINGIFPSALKRWIPHIVPMVGKSDTPIDASRLDTVVEGVFKDIEGGLITPRQHVMNAIDSDYVTLEQMILMLSKIGGNQNTLPMEVPPHVGNQMVGILGPQGRMQQYAMMMLEILKNKWGTVTPSPEWEALFPKGEYISFKQELQQLVESGVVYNSPRSVPFVELMLRILADVSIQEPFDSRL